MTTLEIERLVRKLAAAVSKPGESAAMLKLAEDYAAACRAANLRLRQCEAMLNANDFTQALQLAETPPSLLDLAALLEFREADAWRNYCEINHLAPAEPLEPRAVQRLNEAYARGITTEDPLYKKYRKAVLSKNDLEAFGVLRSIVRLNPSDANAAAELARLDAKVLAGKLDALSRKLDTSSPAEIAGEVEAIENGGFHTRPEGADWHRAQGIRCGHLVDTAGRTRTAGDWRTTMSHLLLLQNLLVDYSLELGPDHRREAEALKQWAERESDQHWLAEDFQRHLGELTRLLEANEEKDTLARDVSLAEIKADFEALHRQWRAIEGFARPVPEELSGRFHKRSALLSAEIARRNRRRFQAAAAVTATALLIIGLAAWWALTQFRAHDFARQLAAAAQSRQVRTAEALVTHVRTKDARLLGVGSLHAAIAQADTFLAHERAALKDFEQAFGALPDTPASGLSPAQVSAIAGNLSRAASLFAKLAPDLQAEQQPRLAAFQNKWERALGDHTTVLNADYEAKLTRLEQGAPQLDYRRGPDETRGLLGELEGLLRQLQEAETAFSSNLTIRSDFRQRGQLAGARVTAFAREMEKFDAAVRAMEQARSFADLAVAIGSLERSEFTDSPLVRAATGWRAAELSDQALLPPLLCPENPNLAAYWKTHPQDNFVPQAAMPAEKTLFQQIQNARTTGEGLFRCRLVVQGDNARNLEWLTVGCLSKEMGWKKIQTYTPAASPSAFTLQETSYGYFDGQYRLSAREMVQSVQELGPCPETSCSAPLKLGGLLAGDTWRGPLLQSLDALKQSTNGSPLFRAYLFLRFMEIMELQPEAWGLAFCPVARAERDDLRKVAGELGDGDWFAPIPSGKLHLPLEKFFASTRSISCLKQAQGLAALTRQAWESGLVFAGYAGADGQPRVVAGAPATDLWGFAADTRKPALLFAGSGHTPLRAALPLAPLFALKESPAELLRRAGIDPADELFARHLPPLFSAVPRPK